MARSMIFTFVSPYGFHKSWLRSSLHRWVIKGEMFRNSVITHKLREIVANVVPVDFPNQICGLETRLVGI
jgi:hypothetical protein